MVVFPGPNTELGILPVLPDRKEYFMTDKVLSRAYEWVLP